MGPGYTMLRPCCGFVEKLVPIRDERNSVVGLIKRFRSRGQHLCKFIGTKENFCIRNKKEFNSHRIGLGHQHGRRFIVLAHQYGRRDVI